MKQTRPHFDIPDSKIPQPQDTTNAIKYFFWRIIYPFFGVGRDTLVALRIIHHKGRQRFFLGNLAPGKKIGDFLKHLQAEGFGNHFVAWKDDGELVSLRRLDGLEGQYHLRIFADGEVRGHYEFTPESHPYWHWSEHGEEERRDEFLKICGDWITIATNQERSYPKHLPQRS
jgi:hypothetical protein